MTQTPISGDGDGDGGLDRRSVLKSTSGAAAGIVGFAGHAKASTSTEEVIQERLQNGGVPTDELSELDLEKIDFEAMDVPEIDPDEIRQQSQQSDCICTKHYCECPLGGEECKSCTCRLHMVTEGRCPACVVSYRCKWDCSCGW